MKTVARVPCRTDRPPVFFYIGPRRQVQVQVQVQVCPPIKGQTMQRDDMTITTRASLNGGAPPLPVSMPMPSPESEPLKPDHHQLQQHLAEAHTELRQLRALLEKARQAERAARYMANHDGLTSLPNRRAFVEHLSHALERSVALDSDLAVLFIDLDHFKAINDTYGHHVGDQLLAIVGSRLAKTVRAADVAARLGGDEFACLLLHAPSVEHIARVASKLFDGIAAPIQLGSLRLQVSASIGIAVRRQGEMLNAEQLMACADQAMYQAKQQQCRFRFARQSAGATG